MECIRMNAKVKRPIAAVTVAVIIGTVSYAWFKREQRQAQLDHTLIEAVRLEEEAAVDTLLAKGASCNASTEYFHVTALIYAARANNKHEVKALLAAGADVNAKSHDGTTALNCAQKHHFNEIESILRAAGAKE
jgi:Ankyrin repeats (3 copies)